MIKSAQDGHPDTFMDIVGQTRSNEIYCKTRGIFMSRKLKHFVERTKKEVPNNGTSF